MSELNNELIKLKNARNTLLSLHKHLVDDERTAYEALHGTVTPGQFLNQLLENPDLEWLRRFSTLIVEIDELMDLNDGIDNGMIAASLDKVKALVDAHDGDDYFSAKYKAGLQRSADAAALQGKLKDILAD